jgi:hypothetical protein
VEVLLEVFFTEHLKQRRLSDNMITIVKSIMLDIMTESGYDK